jgi:hypothetical protein
MSRRDWDALDACHHPDYIEDWPQSRERVRGPENARRTLENYPGGVAGDGVRGFAMVAPEPEYAITPSFTVVRVSGESDRFTAVIRARYPDGSTWYIVTLGRIKDGKLWRATTFYAPELPAPDWRSKWVEPLSEDEALASV